MLLFAEDFERFNKIIGLNHGTILKATTKTGENIFVDVTAYDAHSSAKTIISVRALSNKFLELQNPIAVGQSAVFYDNDTVLGGGIIESVD